MSRHCSFDSPADSFAHALAAPPVRRSAGGSFFSTGSGIGVALCLLTAVLAGCSSGGMPPAAATCSADKPCPDGLVCVVERGLCALPGPGTDDLGIPGQDLARMGSTDLAGTVPDLVTTPPDFATPRDLAGTIPDLAAADLAVPTSDLGMPPSDLATPPSAGPRACFSDHLCWENPLPQLRDLYAVWGTGANDIWAVGGYGVALHWNGTAWLQIPTDTMNGLRAIWGRSTSQFWVGGDNGTLLAWDGTRFTSIPTGTSQSIRGIWGDAATVWTVGAIGTILKWDGSKVTSVPSGSVSSLYAVWGSAGNDVWAVGSDGTACHYGGSAWTCGTEFMSGNALTVTGTARNDVWAMGDMPAAWHWDGTSWTAVPRPNTGTAISQAVALSKNDVRAIGDSSHGWTYDGTSWTTAVVPGGGADLEGLFAIAPSNLYAVGTGSAILRYDGTTWNRLSSGFVAPVSAMWGASDHDVWIFTSDKNAHHFDGSNWTTIALPGVPYSAAGASGSDIWVGSDGGRVFRYDGTSFTTVTTRDTSAVIYGIYVVASDRVVLAGSSSIQFWDGARYTVSVTPSYPTTSAWGSGPNDIWVGLSSSCLAYHFNGSTWSSYVVATCGSGGISGISGTSATDVYFTMQTSTNVNHWDGSNFKAVTGLTLAYAKTAVYATPTQVYLTTSSGEVFAGVGTSWQLLGQFYTGQFTRIAGFAADKVWFGGSGGAVASYKP